MARWNLAWVLGLGSICTSLAFPTLLSAQTPDDDQAHAHFQVAASYYEQANYESALREFLEAYRLSHRSQLFYNLSLCYQQLGDLTNAIDYLTRYLHDVEEIANRASLETRLENLRARLAAHEAGTPPPPEPETHEGASGTTTTDVATTTTTTSTTTDAPAGGATPATSPPSGESLNVGAIVGFTVSGAALIVAAVMSGLTAAEDGRVGMLPCAMARTCTDPQLQRLQTFALVSDVMWALSLAGAAMGLILLIANPGGGGGGSSATAQLRVGPGSLSLEGTF